MTHSEKRLFLIRELLSELPQYSRMKIPDSSEEQQRLLRSLMNIRPAEPVSKEFLKIQDAYLQEEITLRGITEAAICLPVSFRSGREISPHCRSMPL